MNLMENSQKINFSSIIFFSISALIFLFILSLCMGSVKISFSELISSFSDKESASYRILRFVRFPRAMAAFLCGTALSVSGLLIQSVLQNPLGSPNVLGMNSGAGFFVILWTAFFSESFYFLPLAAFLGAFLSLLLVTVLGKKAGSSKHSILLAGVALNTFLVAISDGITVLIPDTIFSRNSFKIGTLSGVQMNLLIPAGTVIILSLILSFLIHNRLEILSLGDESATSLGMNVERNRFLFLILSALLCGAGISFAGLVGFVGLIVPHSARMILGGNQMKKLIPLTAILGADLVLLCDLISRLPSHELPVGILLSILGGPYFFYLLVKNGKK